MSWMLRSRLSNSESVDQARAAAAVIGVRSHRQRTHPLGSPTTNSALPVRSCDMLTFVSASQGQRPTRDFAYCRSHIRNPPPATPRRRQRAWAQCSPPKFLSLIFASPHPQFCCVVHRHGHGDRIQRRDPGQPERRHSDRRGHPPNDNGEHDLHARPFISGWPSKRAIISFIRVTTSLRSAPLLM